MLLDGVVEEEPEQDPNYEPPQTFAEVMYRIDAEEVFFHVTSAVHSQIDPWEYELHDYYVLSAFWKRFAPPHLVASAFVSKGDGKDEKHKSSTPSSPQGKVNSEATYAMLTGDPAIAGQVFRGKADGVQRKRLDYMFDVMAQLKNGVNIKDIPI